jgi:diguanylate cyclase (GGDEF)-like protein
MELKIYLRILMRKWWLFVPIFLLTVISTVVFTLNQPPVYKATTTFVATASDSFENFAYGLDLLGRQGRIPSTYAEVANSHLIKVQAADELGLSPEQIDNLSVESRALADTNVLEITAYGSDPALTRVFVNTVAAKTVAYVENLYQAYKLELLDEAVLPSTPIEPNKTLNLAIGTLLALVLGISAAFLSEYLQTPAELTTNFGILDDETGVYNERYLTQRLREEMSRAKRNGYPLSLCLMNVDHRGVMDSLPPQARSETLRQVALMAQQHLREEDIIAHPNGTVFAFLFPDTPGEKAKEVLERLKTSISLASLAVGKSNVKVNLTGVAGVASYRYNGANPSELLDEASRALNEAGTAGNGKVHLLAYEEDQPATGKTAK